MRGFETLLMVNFGQKTAIFWRWNQDTKKKYHREVENIVWNQSGFKKTDFRFGETTFGFTIIWLFSKSAYVIAAWRVKVSRFENENEDVFEFPIRLGMKSLAQLAI